MTSTSAIATVAAAAAAPAAAGTNLGVAPIKTRRCPVTVNIQYLTDTNGYHVVLWHPESSFVDYEMIERWLKSEFPSTAIYVDLQNIHHVAHKITEMKEVGILPPALLSPDLDDFLHWHTHHFVASGGAENAIVPDRYYLVAKFHVTADPFYQRK